MVRASTFLWWGRAIFAVAAFSLGVAVAAPVALSNDDLSEVVGGDGISLFFHVEVNSADTGSETTGARFTRSFTVNGTTTYATAQGLRGVIDALGVSIDVGARPDSSGGSYIDIGLPRVLAVNQFGYRAFGVQTDPLATVQPEQNFGGVLLHGLGTQTGHFLMWAQ